MPEETVHASFSLVRQSMRGIVAIYTEAEPNAAAEGGHFSTTLSLEIGPLEVEPLVAFFAAGILRLAELPVSRRKKDAKP